MNQGTLAYNPYQGIYPTNPSVGYFNIAVPAGVGSDMAGIVADLNLLDNPAINGANNPPNSPFGSHSYAGFDLQPSFAGATEASMTIANAIGDTTIPTVVGIENGGHAISVYGVKTTGGQPGAANQNYTINGFFLHDPWTGYAVSQWNAGNQTPAVLGGFGLGYNTYIRYGYNANQPQGGLALTLPNGNQVVNARLSPWFRIFNPAPGLPNTPANTANWGNFSTRGYQFVTDPESPVGNGEDYSNNGALSTAAELSSPLALASSAGSFAASDLAGDTALSSSFFGPDIGSQHQRLPIDATHRPRRW